MLLRLPLTSVRRQADICPYLKLFSRPMIRCWLFPINNTIQQEVVQEQLSDFRLCVSESHYSTIKMIVSCFACLTCFQPSSWSIYSLSFSMYAEVLPRLYSDLIIHNIYPFSFENIHL